MPSEMPYMKYKLLAVIILLGVLIPPLSHAQTFPGPYPLFQLSQNQHQSLEMAVEKIKRQTGGRILSAKTIGKANRRVHVIKVLLPSGKVRIYKVASR
jgi:hypothetical protein